MSTYTPEDRITQDGSNFLISQLTLRGKQQCLAFEKQYGGSKTILAFDNPTSTQYVRIPANNFNTVINVQPDVPGQNYTIPPLENGKVLSNNGSALTWVNGGGGGGNMIISESNKVTLISSAQAEIINYVFPNADMTTYIKARFIIRDMQANYSAVKQFEGTFDYNGAIIIKNNINEYQYSNPLALYLNNVNYTFTLINTNQLSIKVNGIDGKTIKISAYIEFIEA